MKKPNVVILGGGYAGLMAASRLARTKVATITLVDQSPYFEQRIRYHEVLAGASASRGALSQWLQAAGVGFTQAQVNEIHSGKRRLITNTGTLDYDFLVITTGSRIDRGRIAGGSELSHSLNSQDQCQRLGESIAALAHRGGHLLLIGGGLTQLETATELAERHPTLRITLLTSQNPFASFHPQAERYFRAHLQQAQITLLEHHTVHALQPGRCETSQGALTFDLCLCAPGFAASPLLARLSHQIDDHGRAKVTDTLQLAGDDRIWVAGDSAAFPWQGPMPLRMGCAVALPMGAQAGENVAALLKGRDPQPFSFGFLMRCVSLGRKAGVVQMTQWNDAPKNRAFIGAHFTGAKGAWIKERICRMTFNVPRWELATGLRLYRWPSVPTAYRSGQTTAINTTVIDSAKG